jgi:hypothetical protein
MAKFALVEEPAAVVSARLAGVTVICEGGGSTVAETLTVAGVGAMGIL